VRELRNTVERAQLFSRGGPITVDELPPTLPRSAGTPRKSAPQAALTLQEAAARAEMDAIRTALAATDGQKIRAAELLGVSRKTLWEKMKTYGIGDDAAAASS
jgi:DNA-binding NtrC family response regulator